MLPQRINRRPGFAPNLTLSSVAKLSTAVCLITILPAVVHGQGSEGRCNAGAQIVWEFGSAATEDLADSISRQPASLVMETPSTAQVDRGAVVISGKSFIRPRGRTNKLHRAATWTDELSIEVWLEPADLNQSGPARIVSFSRDGSRRNFTLGQDGNRYDVRLRTTTTSDNGLPSVASPAGAVTKKLTHVVYTRARSGRATIHLNGKPVVEKVVSGNFSNWDPNFRLIVGNEHSGDRTWKGKIHLVAIFNRALSTAEIRRNYRAGKDASAIPTGLIRSEDPFLTRVAPLLAKHCVECHDPANRQGGLDLTSFAAAKTGGDTGPALVPGKLDESLMWEQVETDEMPHDRPPLSKEEKKDLRDWLQNGARWTVAKVDPAVFLRRREVDPSLARRLTVEEYIASVKMTTGVDISQPARQLFPPDLRADGFNNTAYNLTVDLKHVETLARLAEKIVSQVDVSAFRKKFAPRAGFDESGLRDLIRSMGTWMLRGPLSEAEVRHFLVIGETVRLGEGTLDEATAFILEAMLQSPRFVYQLEQQRGDGTRWPVNLFELANRTSFVVWGTPPDEELFKLAANGRLADPAVFQKQVSRMLDDPRAIKRSLQFVSQWLNLGRLANMRPDPKKYPNWKPELAEDMRQESLQFFEEVVWNQERPVGDLFAARFAFVNRRLADHYGMRKELLENNNRLQKIALDKGSRRQGLLTQGSVLTVGGDEASMVTRGLFVLENVLRGIVKDPPPCVDTTPVATGKGVTQRSIAEFRINNVNCGGCHRRIEPLAFGLEKYDGLGVYHESDEHGNRLREDGQLLIPGAAQPVKYDSVEALTTALANSDRVAETIVWKVTQFSIGRPLGPEDVEVMEDIVDHAKKNGWTYPAILNAIVKSQLVQTKVTEPYPEQ